MAPEEQLDLIDVSPPNAKKIKKIARQYKAAQRQRLQFLEEEKAFKAKILQAVKEAHLQPLEDGKIKFRLDGMTITITPRDELIQVKEDSPED